MVDVILLKQAYKKLKSSVYFDKTQLILRDKIVDFEANFNEKNFFENFADEINNLDKFKKLQIEILESISLISFPKKLEEHEQDEKNKKKLITNFYLDEIKINEVQYFIDMDIRGHILGVIWLMKIGYIIDNNIYAHSFGNRIQKGLINEFSNKPTCSPYLFEPYFVQYEGWRDNAMDEALRHMKSNQDMVIFTMDFKRYYYSVNMNKNAFDELYKDASKSVCDNNLEIYKLINDFIYEVVHRYSTLFHKNEFKN